VSAPSSEQTVRAGVVGLGWAGRQHMEAYASQAGVELVGLAGMEADQLALLGDKYGVAEEHRFADWQDLVAAGCVDVLSIATPTTLHAPIAVAALDAGLHVLSEKPMAENAEVGQTMVDAARRNGKVLEVSFNHRRRGDVQVLKQLIEAGQLGDIYYAKAGWLRREGIPGMGSWFTRQAKSGGGPLMDIGVHMLDMALHLLGEPQVTTATAATYAEFGPRGKGAAAYGLGRKTDVTADDFDVEDLATCGWTAVAPCCWSRAGPSGFPSISATSRCTAPKAGRASSGVESRASPTASSGSGPRRTVCRPSSPPSCRRTVSTWRR
jgi:predicted dehydrogenase